METILAYIDAFFKSGCTPYAVIWKLIFAYLLVAGILHLGRLALRAILRPFKKTDEQA
jgi:hypothetical protein